MDNSGSALKCDPPQFLTIYQDLLQLGTLDHEKIILKAEGQRFFPATAKKDIWDLTPQDEKTSKVVLDFLEKHIEIVSQQSHPGSLFFKLHPYFEGDKGNQLNKIFQKIFRAVVDNKTQSEIFRRNQEAEKSTREQAARQMNVRVQSAEERLQELEASIKVQEQRLASLKDETLSLQDTLIICKDNAPLHCHSQLLEKITYFKVYKSECQKELVNAGSVTKSFYKYEFKDFQFNIMDIFIRWLDSPEALLQVDSLDDLLELYRLSVCLYDFSFKNACLEIILKQLTQNNALKILSQIELRADDMLIQTCCDLIATQFKQAKAHLKFLEINPMYFISILKNEQLNEESELEVFKALIGWAEAQAKQNCITLKDQLCLPIQGQRLIDSIRFSNLTREQFLFHVLPLGVLSAEEVYRWLIHYVNTPSISHSRFYMLQCQIKNSAKAEISWNMPLNVLSTIGEWMDNKCNEIFTFNNCLWSFRFGKANGKIVIGIWVEKHQMDFDYFLEINSLRFYSNQSDQSDMQTFTHDAAINTGCIKGVKYDLKTLEDNIDPASKCLPLRIQLFIR